MGTCCTSREKGEFEILIDDFFNKMKVTQMTCTEVNNIITTNLDTRNKFYEGNVAKFLEKFVGPYVIRGGSENDVNWVKEVNDFFTLQFNTGITEGTFNLLASLLLLTKDISTKPEYITSLAKRFRIDVQNDKDISKTAFESLLQHYIRFVSTDTSIFISDLTVKKQEFHEFSTAFFNESSVTNLMNEFLIHYKDQSVDINDFLLRFQLRLHHSEIRVRMIESTPDRSSKTN